MRVSARLSIAVHVLSLLEVKLPTAPTSEFMASSIGVNAVIVRNIVGQLKAAGLVVAHQGKAGASLARPASEITLLDIFRAVDATEEVFSFHQNPHPECPVGANIQVALEGELRDAQRQMESRLSQTTLAQVVDKIAKLSGI